MADHDAPAPPTVPDRLLEWPPPDDDGIFKAEPRRVARPGEHAAPVAPLPTWRLDGVARLAREAGSPELPLDTVGGGPTPLPLPAPAVGAAPAETPDDQSPRAGHDSSARWWRVAAATLLALVVIEGVVILRDRPAAPPSPAAPTAPAAPGVEAGPAAPSPSGESASTAAVATSGANESGALDVRSQPAGAIVTIDGVARGRTPIVVRGLAVGGHAVQITAGAARFTGEVTVAGGGTTNLVVPLVASGPPAGWIEVATVGDDTEVHLDDQLIGLARQGRFLVPAGGHRVAVSSEALGWTHRATVNVPPGGTVRVAPQPMGTLHVNATPWAHVWVDGRDVGETPLAALSVALGRRAVRFEHPELGTHEREVVVTGREAARLSVDMRVRQ